MSKLQDKLNIRRAIVVKPELTADDWQLYTDSVGVEHIAERLNEQLRKAVNEGKNKGEVNSYMQNVMASREFAQFGANDTEPLWVLTDLLNLIFGS